MNKLTTALLAIFIVLGFNSAFAQTFEYARLSQMEMAAIETKLATWQTAGERMSSNEGYRGLFEEIFQREPGDGEYVVLAMMNHFGAEGWQLIQFNRTSGSINHEEYLFIKQR